MENLTNKPVGRPRKFDEAQALEKATQVFCEYGYEGAALSKLTEAMNINSPSLYAAFGDKEQLFLKVLDEYHRPFREMAQSVLFGEETALGGFGKLFQVYSESYNSCDEAQGCLIVNSTINNKDGHEAIGEKIKSLHKETEDIYYQRLKQGQSDGDVSHNVNIRALARYIHGVFQGAAVMIRGRQSKAAVEDLLSVSHTALVDMLEK